jgi:hypothetical protein
MTSMSEQICRISLMLMFPGHAFQSQRPDWLMNPMTGRNLELDCLSMSLMLAVEYQGAQHKRWPNVFHKTKREFLAQVQRDAYKAKACELVGVKLVCVDSDVAPFDIPMHLYREVSKLHQDGILRKKPLPLSLPWEQGEKKQKSSK